MKRTFAIIIMATSWIGVGIMLMYRGLYAATQNLTPENMGPLLKFFARFNPSLEQGSLLVVCLGLLLGFIKGKTVLKKAATRMVDYLQKMEEPIPLSKVVPLRFVILVGLMMALGITLRKIGTPMDVLGCINVAVGSALVHGAGTYFKIMQRINQKSDS